MENLLLNYFQTRMDKERIFSNPETEYGPVVTITREYGCPGKTLADELVYRINREDPPTKWNWIDKEVLKILARELKLSPSVIDDLQQFEERKLSDYVALIFSSDCFPGDKKIKNTIAEIILTYAQQGHYVIVGRAGHFITGHISRSYHVALKAPLKWRIEHMSQHKNCSYSEAQKLVAEMSEKRQRFLSHFAKGKENRAFDSVFDCSEISIDEMAEVILLDLKRMELI